MKDARKLKSSFVQTAEKMSNTKAEIEQNSPYLQMDTPGGVCTNLQNDTPGQVCMIYKRRTFFEGFEKPLWHQGFLKVGKIDRL